MVCVQDKETGEEVHAQMLLHVQMAQVKHQISWLLTGSAQYSSVVTFGGKVTKTCTPPAHSCMFSDETGVESCPPDDGFAVPLLGKVIEDSCTLHSSGVEVAASIFVALSLLLCFYCISLHLCLPTPTPMYTPAPMPIPMLFSILTLSPQSRLVACFMCVSRSHPQSLWPLPNLFH